MCRRVRDSRGAAQRCGPYFSYLSKAKVKRRWWSNRIYRLRYWNWSEPPWLILKNSLLQQYLPFTVCAEGCETAEEQSDDEVRTSQVPERREGKTKVIKQQYLPFTVLKLRTNIREAVNFESCNSTYRLRYWNAVIIGSHFFIIFLVATSPTACGMRRRVRDSRGAKRRWSPHISSTWTKWR